jgi:hypothetical protein
LYEKPRTVFYNKTPIYHLPNLFSIFFDVLKFRALLGELLEIATLDTGVLQRA